jgi:hypothetical protein
MGSTSEVEYRGRERERESVELSKKFPQQEKRRYSCIDLPGER